MTIILLNKFIASSGHCSRRKADELIAEGKVLVNNVPIKEMGYKVDPELDTINIRKGPQIKAQKEPLLIALNKPKGYVCTKQDPFHDKTVYRLLPNHLQHLFTIGRLDVDTEGLIMLTNNGELANMYAHPRHQKQKTYIVEVRGELTMQHVAKIAKGMHLKEYKTKPAHAKILGYNKESDRTTVEIHLKEGKKRQIRNMFLALKHPVKRLIRTGFGPYTIGHLKPGEWKKVETSPPKRTIQQKDINPAYGA